MPENALETVADVETFYSSSTPTAADEAMQFCTTVVHRLVDIRRIVGQLEAHVDIQSRQAYAEMITEITRVIDRDAADLERTISIIGNPDVADSDLAAVNELIRNVLLTTGSPFLAKSAANLRTRLAPHLQKAGI